jgi:hypothetical protein
MCVEGGFQMPDNKLDQLDAEFEKVMKELEELEAQVEPEASDPTDDDTDVEEEVVQEEQEEDDDDLGNAVFEVSKDEEDKKSKKDAAAFKEMREQQAKLKSELEEKQKLIEEFELMSKSSGFGDVNQLLDQWRQQQLEQESKARGVPADVLKQIEEQKRRLEKLEREKNELEQKTKQQTVVKQIDSIVSELKLTPQEADTLINTMGADGVTWEQLLVLPPAAISNAVKGYATSIILEKERQSLIKKQQSKDEFQEDKIQGKRTNPKNNSPFSQDALQKEIEAYRKKNFPHLK